MSKTKNIHINQGVTMKLIFLGVVVLFGAIAMAVFLGLWLSIPMFYFGLVFFLSIKGATFNIEKKQVRIHWSFFFFKVGQWQSINEFDTVLLSPYQKSGQYTTGRSSTRSIRTKSYDLYLSNKNGETLEIKEFSDYYAAVEAMEQIAEVFNLNSDDQFLEMMEGIQARRAARGRR